MHYWQVYHDGADHHRRHAQDLQSLTFDHKKHEFLGCGAPDRPRWGEALDASVAPAVQCKIKLRNGDRGKQMHLRLCSALEREKWLAAIEAAMATSVCRLIRWLTSRFVLRAARIRGFQQGFKFATC
jgi:hypothetical protein